MERLLLLRFFREIHPTISAELYEILQNPKSFPTSLGVFAELANKYNCFKDDIRNGKYGKNSKFWLIYLDMMQHQNYIHTAVQENDFDLRLHTWNYFLPFFFATNKCNYARYGSYYVHQIKSIDTMFPGMKDILMNSCISIQAQDKYPIRT